ncbi:uncharacterized protein LOC141587605 [Silene latifolia]|uniref:uncharacterized protein LOC141587605 n=1 Tax=Silene latifolia TaxID=37657 RepID=UPI003D76E828
MESLSNGGSPSFAINRGMSFNITNNEAYEEESDVDIEDNDIANDPMCPTILLTKAEKIKIRRHWKDTLITKMFDKNIGYFTLLRQIKKKWALKGGLSLMDVGFSFYVARFTNKEDYEHVISQGPWMIGDHYLTIRKWVPNFVATDEPIRHLTTWIRIPCLSVEYYHEDILRKIGSKVGKVIRIDKPTALAERGQFIRMSVEVDLTKPLL